MVARSCQRCCDVMVDDGPVLSSENRNGVGDEIQGLPVGGSDQVGGGSSVFNGGPSSTGERPR